MKKMTIEADCDAEQVTINIPHEKKPEACTLKQAIAMTPVDRLLLVRIKEPNGRTWTLDLGYKIGGDDPAEREKRIGAIHDCEFCNSGVLLDRTVERVDIQDVPGHGYAIVYEVDV